MVAEAGGGGGGVRAFFLYCPEKIERAVGRNARALFLETDGWEMPF